MKKLLKSIFWFVVAVAYVEILRTWGELDSAASKLIYMFAAGYVTFTMFDNLNGDENMGGWERFFCQIQSLIKSNRAKVAVQAELDMPTHGVMIYHSPAWKHVDGQKVLNHQRSTIVARYNSESGEICFAASRCSTKEQFSRRVGRNIAIQRLNAGECIQSAKPVGDDSVQWTFITIAKNLCTWLEDNQACFVNSKSCVIMVGKAC